MSLLRLQLFWVFSLPDTYGVWGSDIGVGTGERDEFNVSIRSTF